MENNRKGDLAEFYAVTWLWDNGYEAFLNAGCTGPIDIIAYKDGEVIFIDVKTSQLDRRKDKQTCKQVLTKQQREMGVVILLFNPETRKLRWVNHKNTEDKQLGLELE